MRCCLLCVTLLLEKCIMKVMITETIEKHVSIHGQKLSSLSGTFKVGNKPKANSYMHQKHQLQFETLLKTACII